MSNTTSRVRLCFIRHAQSEANLSPTTICGQNILSGLSPLGCNQAILLGKRLKYQNIQFDYLLCSTAKRAILTAEIILKIMNIDTSKLITSSAFLEQSQGDWEGMDRNLCYNMDTMKQMGEIHIEFIPPNGESLRMVQKRAIEVLEPFIDQAKKQSIEENREIVIAIFSHANLIRAVLQYYLQSNPKHTWLIDLLNTSISEIVLNELGIALVKVNDGAHLVFPMLKSEEDS